MDSYIYIKKQILHGEFPPKMRLTEEYLAKQLQLSRTPIREALKQLESEGLLLPMKRGVRVRHYTKEDIRQIYDVRTLLEGYAASQAALHRTHENLEEMKKANDHYEQTINAYFKSSGTTVEDVLELNHAFHETIVKASKNQHIFDLISKTVVLPLIFRSFYWFNEEQMRNSHTSHNTILQAIEEQDIERARVAMHEHIYHGRDQVLPHIEAIAEDYSITD
ncbi:DNA-binding transcriptional regulator, GntR family [Lentibacillus persicus]|uniref:DNA-binding transcriptional regulator, GntR family n=1 Tax=Lentibacillus persicus TaxID=640948 RepID=A0A1I1W621_9BACI|nr:GntR family transcriptional regulator [Lentibacillus persicus]SFD90645.1 DNA-binding transcriptional regulator, GntR family [Lentibacillus persicus]